MDQSTSRPNNKNGNVSEQTVRDLIELQKEELAIRQQENQLRLMEVRQSYELSKESLKQQGAYLKAAPKHEFNNRLVIALFFICTLLIIAGVLVYCVHLGKEEIALRILEIIATAIISAGGGYAWGKSKGQQKEEPKVEIME